MPTQNLMDTSFEEGDEYKKTIDDILNDCNISEEDGEEQETLLPVSQPPVFTETVLFKLLTHPSRKNLVTALHVIERMEPHELNICGDDGSSYLHVLVRMAPVIFKLNETHLPAIPVLYRLAVAGVDVNTVTAQGNSALHLAAVRPEAAELVQHLIRIGVDPALSNIRSCSAFYIYSRHLCQLLKTQNVAPCGVWRAVCGEDFDGIKKFIASAWGRINCYRDGLSLLFCAGETGNNKVVEFLKKYSVRNELIITALACDALRLKKLLKTATETDIQQLLNAADESFRPGKPLITFLREFGEDMSGEVLEILRKIAHLEESQQFPIDKLYIEQTEYLKIAFEDSDFYKAIAESTAKSLDQALDLLSSGKVNIHLCSHQLETEGWTFLHLIADKWRSDMNNRKPELQRRYIRLVYRLALLGLDINARNGNHETALIKSFDAEDPVMAMHLLRCGADGSLASPGGVVIGSERYQFQGRLVARAKMRSKDVAGLWAAVEASDITRVERWLSSWCRVNAVRDDRTVLDAARALGNAKIIALLEKYRHTTELVSAALACDYEKVKLLLALGKRMCNLNPVDNYHFVGLLPKRSRIETIPRPFIITAMEICTPPIVAMLVKFGADLVHFYEEAAPCGPVAFWAFRPGIDPAVTMVIAESAALSMRDERGQSLLHRALTKPEQENKKEIVETLINRGIDIAMRDVDGSTARNCITIHDIPEGDCYRSMIDLHILELAVKGKLEYLENLLLQGYDHILSIRGPPKNRTITEHVTLKNLTEVKQFLDEIKLVEKEIEEAHELASTGNVTVLARFTEKFSIYGKDKGGRTLLHKAVLYNQDKVVAFIQQQLPQLLNLTDNLNRTALHYCACLPAADRKKMWQLLGSKTSGCNLAMLDVNNMTAADYVKEMENETPCEAKRRGRQTFNYRVQAVLEEELTKQYGHVYKVYTAYHALLERLSRPGALDGDEEVLSIGKECAGSYSNNEWNGQLLYKCVLLKLQDNALNLWRQLLMQLPPEELKTDKYHLTIMVQERVRTAQRAPPPGARSRRQQAQQQQAVQLQEVKKDITTSLLEACKHQRLQLLEKIWQEYIEEEEAKNAPTPPAVDEAPTSPTTASFGTQTESAKEPAQQTQTELVKELAQQNETAIEPIATS